MRAPSHVGSAAQLSRDLLRAPRSSPSWDGAPARAAVERRRRSNSAGGPSSAPQVAGRALLHTTAQRGFRNQSSPPFIDAWPARIRAALTAGMLRVRPFVFDGPFRTGSPHRTESRRRCGGCPAVSDRRRWGSCGRNWRRRQWRNPRSSTQLGLLAELAFGGELQRSGDGGAAFGEGGGASTAPLLRVAKGNTSRGQPAAVHLGGA